jgi:hypothetical protein
MVSTLYLKRLDDGKITHMLWRAPSPPTPILKNPRNHVNPDSKPGYGVKWLFSPPHIHGVPLELKIFLN